MKHILKITLITLNGALGLIALFTVLRVYMWTIEDPDNIISLATNLQGEMWVEFYFFVFSTITMIIITIYLAITEIVKELRKRNGSNFSLWLQEGERRTER